MFFPQESEYIMQNQKLSTIKKKPLFLNLSDFKIIVESLDDLESFEDYRLDQAQLTLRAKVQTIISYIERARLRSAQGV